MNHRNTTSVNRFLAISYAAFWATIFIVRVVEFIALLYNRFPAIFIDRTHVHHFVTGFLLMLAGVLLVFLSDIADAVPATIFGIGLGLMADEFLYWTLGRFNYWSFANCVGTIIIALLLLAAVYLTLEPNEPTDDAEPDSAKKIHHAAAHDQPLISVVIPAHNEKDFLPATLRALSAQTYPNYEVIVVDSNSTDATPEIAAAHGARVITERRPGVAAARQAGFMAANGTIIASTDADTIVPADWLSKIAGHFAAHPKTVAYGGIYSLYSGPLSARIMFPDIAYLAWCMNRLAKGSWALPGANMAVRREAFLAVGGFNLDKNVMEDADLSQRLAKLGPVDFDREHLVRTSGRRYGKGFIKGLAPYAGATPAHKVMPKRINTAFTAVREDKTTEYSFLAVLIPAALLLFLFALHGPAVVEAHRTHNQPGYLDVFAHDAWTHIRVINREIRKH